MRNLLILAALLFLSCCYSVKKAVEESHPASKEINWPEAYLPEESKFFVHNEIDVQAYPETIWQVLIHAQEWEEYYQGASNLSLDNASGKLSENSTFTWKTMGLDFTSKITEFDPPYRLAWESSRKNIKGYHAWLIIPTDTGSKLITSEAQHGFMTLPQKIFVPKKLEGLHNDWLAAIKRKSENSEQ